MGRSLARPAVLLATALLCTWHSQVLAEDPKTLSISEISFARTGHGIESDKLPSDVLTLRSDGSATYEGKENVDRIGRFKGRILEYDFKGGFRLLAAQFVELRKQPFSTGKPSRGGSILIRVTQDGKPTEIRDWCPGLDIRLWAFEMSARGIASDINWERDHE